MGKHCQHEITDVFADFSQAEWDKYFPIEQNTGDLNIPDFDFSNFTEGYSGPAMGPSDFATAGTGINIPSAQDLADVNFTHTYIPGSVPNTYQNMYHQ